MTALGLLDTIGHDTRYALRTMRRSPVFTATAVLIVGLAVGGNTAIFTVIRAVLLKPLQYPHAERLVNLGGATPSRLAELETGAHSFTEIGTFTNEGALTISGGAEPEVLRGVWVSATFLRILGVDPLLGRGFLPQEDSEGGPPVAMISTELWQRRFAGDPKIVGKTTDLSDTPYTIVGVLPSRFQFPVPDVDVWLTAPSEWPLMPPRSRVLSPFLNVFGRLKPGVSLTQANAELTVLRHQYAAGHPTMLDAKPKSPVEVTAMKDDMVRNARSMLWMLFGAVGFVLLIACANVASLLLARASARSREFAVRSALGAARSRLLGQLLVESLLLSCAGGLIGASLAAWGLRMIPRLTAFELPRASEIHFDWVVIGFAAALSGATGVLFGLAPSLSASRPDLIAVLRTNGSAANQGRLGRLNARTVLSVAQIALSIILLIGAALLMETVSRLRGIDVGFDPANLLTVSLSLPLARYNTVHSKESFWENVLREVRSEPGIRSAAAAWFLPMTGFAGTPVQDASKPPLKLNERPIAKFLPVSPSYFHALGIPLRRGRDFDDHDTEEAERVAIIDENLARHFWPDYPRGVDPVGQRLLIGGVDPKPAKIIGVAGNVHQNLEGDPWAGTAYVSFTQNAQAFGMLAIRTAGDPLSFTKAVRAQVRGIDPDQPIAEPRTMDDLVEAQIGQKRVLTILLQSFAAMALLLALVGIYGVIAYSVAQRTQEVGIRRALGAQQTDILRMVIGQGLSLALVGVILGLAGAFSLTRLMKTLLFGVSATDPVVFITTAALFLLAALLAIFIPALRAMRIDPMAALRV